MKKIEKLTSDRLALAKALVSSNIDNIWHPGEGFPTCGCCEVKGTNHPSDIKHAEWCVYRLATEIVEADRRANRVGEPTSLHTYTIAEINSVVTYAELVKAGYELDDAFRTVPAHRSPQFKRARDGKVLDAVLVGTNGYSHFYTKAKIP